MNANVQFEIEIRKDNIIQKAVFFDSKEQVINYIYKANLEIGQDDLVNGYAMYKYQTYVISFPGFRLDIKSLGGLYAFWEYANAIESGQKIDSSSYAGPEAEVLRIMRTIKDNRPSNYYSPSLPPSPRVSSSSKGGGLTKDDFLEYICMLAPFFLMASLILILIGIFEDPIFVVYGVVALVVGLAMLKHMNRST